MRATSLLRTAWLWLLDYAYVGRWQVQGLFSPADETVYLAPGAAGQPVVLLPGVYERWQFMRPVADLLQGLGHPVHVVARLRWNAAPLDASARLVADHLEQHDLRDVLVVAHSNSIRALVKHLERLSDDEIVRVNVPTGMPLVYNLTADLEPAGGTGSYLDAAAASSAAAAVADEGR